MGRAWSKLELQGLELGQSLHHMLVEANTVYVARIPDSMCSMGNYATTSNEMMIIVGKRQSRMSDRALGVRPAISAKIG